MTPVPKKRIYPPDQLFWDNVKKTPSGCWHWIGATTGPTSRARPAIVHKKKKYTPRQWGWVLIHGYSERALLVTCGNQMCVNPDHMRTARVGTCIRGHPISGDNLYVEPGGRHVCRTCKRARQRTPRQRFMRHQLHLGLSDEQRRSRADRAKAVKREKALNSRRAEVAAEVAVWSSAVNRWLLFEGHRWIRGGEHEAYSVVATHLRSKDLLPHKGGHRLEEEHVAVVRHTLQRLKAQAQLRMDNDECMAEA